MLLAVLRYLGTRLAAGVVGFVLLSSVIFSLARLSGDPVLVFLPIDATREQIEALRSSLGLDRPVPVQFAHFLGNVAKGDFGVSLSDRRPALGLVVDRLPATVLLSLTSFSVSVLLAFPLGIIAAYFKRGPLDRAVTIFGLLGQSVPAFWLGIVFIQVFSVNVRLFPAAGMDGPANYVLPSVTLGWFSAATLMRVLRSSLIDVLDSEYVKFLRSQGFSEWTIVWKHGLRNALIPVLSVGGVLFAIFLTGAIVTETVFAWPGIGRLSFQAIKTHDFPVIQAVMLLTAGLVIVVNLAIDALYVVVDPRLRA